MESAASRGRLQSMTRREYRCNTVCAPKAAPRRCATPAAPTSQAMWLASWSSDSPSEPSERGMQPARVIADDEEGRAPIGALHIQRGRHRPARAARRHHDRFALRTSGPSRRNKVPAAGCGVGHRTIGQPDNLVDPPQGRRDTMEGPADSSDHAQVATDVESSRSPTHPMRPFRLIPPRPCRITFHGFVRERAAADRGAGLARAAGGSDGADDRRRGRDRGRRPGAQGTSLSRSHGAGDARRSRARGLRSPRQSSARGCLRRDPQRVSRGAARARDAVAALRHRCERTR